MRWRKRRVNSRRIERKAGRNTKAEECVKSAARCESESGGTDHGDRLSVAGDKPLLSVLWGERTLGSVL